MIKTELALVKLHVDYATVFVEDLSKKYVGKRVRCYYSEYDYKHDFRVQEIFLFDGVINIRVINEHNHTYTYGLNATIEELPDE